MYLLSRCGMPGLEYAIAHGFWPAACSVSLLLGFFRAFGMPTSSRSLIKPLQHKPASK